MEYSSNAKGNLGVTLGAIGTGLAALGNNGSGLLGGIFGGGSQYVSKETAELMVQLQDSKRDNAILSADLNTEKKMVEVFNAATAKTTAVRDELTASIRALENKVDSGNAAQAVINCQCSSAVNLLQNQVGQLFGLTQLKIPNTSVCPGWGDVKVTPVVSGGTATV